MRYLRRILWRFCRPENAGRRAMLNSRNNSLQKQRDDLLHENWRLRREVAYQTETAAYLRAKLANIETRQLLLQD